MTRCCHWRLKNSASQLEPWDPISLVAISCSDNLVGSRRWPSPEVGEGNAATRFHQSAWLLPVHKETAGPCVRIVEDGDRLPRYYEPLRHPRAPGLSLAGVRLIIADHSRAL